MALSGLVGLWAELRKPPKNEVVLLFFSLVVDPLRRQEDTATELRKRILRFKSSRSGNKVNDIPLLANLKLNIAINDLQ